MRPTPPFELHREVKRGNTARVRELLRDGTDVNATDRSGHTPLVYALESPQASVELLELLLDHGAGAPEIATACLHGGDPLKLTAVLNRGVDLNYRTLTAMTRS